MITYSHTLAALQEALQQTMARNVIIAQIGTIWSNAHVMCPTPVLLQNDALPAEGSSYSVQRQSCRQVHTCPAGFDGSSVLSRPLTRGAGFRSI